MLVLSNFEIMSSSHFYFKSANKYSSANNIKSHASSISTGNYYNIYILYFFPISTINPL